MPPGYVIGSLLCIIYIIYVATRINMHINNFLFTNDSKIFSQSNDVLQLQFDKINRSLETYLLKLNPNECSFLNIHKTKATDLKINNV